MMTHYDTDTLDDYLRGELEPARDAAIHAHLEICAVCRAAYDEAATLRDWVRAAAADHEREFPSIVKARVWETIRTESARPSPWRAFWAPWLAIPVAAAIAVFAYVGVPATHAPAAGITASDFFLAHAAQMADNPLADHSVVVPASTAEMVQPSTSLIEAVDAATVADPNP
jgi:predicted anti-sigma-YlaC factor YlaD